MVCFTICGIRNMSDHYIWLQYTNSFVHQGPAWLACGAEMALEERARSCLLRFRHKLEQDIKPSYLMDHMVSDGVLTVDEEEKIRTQVSML